MSLVDSDFGDEGFEDALDEVPEEGGDMDASMEASAPAAPAPVYRKQGFNIYSVLLILSFVFLTTAMIITFNVAGKLQ